MRTIKIFDTTLRDGEQSPGASLTINEKLIIAKQLAKLNVDVIEAGFPISSKGDFEAVKLIAQKVQGPTICGLARCSKEDIDKAWEALKHSEKPRIHVFIATSDIHIDKKLRKTKEDIKEIAINGIKHAKSYTDDIEFSPEDAARTDLDYMCEIIEAAIQAGASTINIPDTVGYAMPEEFGNRIKHVIENVPNADKITISIHCHNDLGNAVANSLSAVKQGATQVESCINGLGERAGNASTEEIIMNLNVRQQYFNAKTNINTKEIYKTSKLVSDLTGIKVQRNKAIVGENAFAHESGIHQHGILEDKDTYEIMKPEDVGWHGDNLVLGKHSGKHAVEAVLKEHGFELDKKQTDQVLKKIKDLADKQKTVQTQDILAIASDITNQLTEEHIKLDEISVITGNKITPTATVKLLIDNKMKIGAGVGVGPVDAMSQAIRSIIGPQLKLKEYDLKAITGGTNALADVSITLEDKNKKAYRASAINEDIVMASAQALIKGANLAIQK